MADGTLRAKIEEMAERWLSELDERPKRGDMADVSLRVDVRLRVEQLRDLLRESEMADALSENAERLTREAEAVGGFVQVVDGGFAPLSVGAVAALDAIQPGDNEKAHVTADEVLLDLVPREVRDAYERAEKRVRGFWYA